MRLDHGEGSSSVELAFPADQVWHLIGGFGSLPDWLPYIPKSELREGGRTRHLADPDGSTIVERLVAFDEKATVDGLSERVASPGPLQKSIPGSGV